MLKGIWMRIPFQPCLISLPLCAKMCDIKMILVGFCFVCKNYLAAVCNGTFGPIPFLCCMNRTWSHNVFPRLIACLNICYLFLASSKICFFFFFIAEHSRLSRRQNITWCLILNINKCCIHRIQLQVVHFKRQFMVI